MSISGLLKTSNTASSGSSKSSGISNLLKASNASGAGLAYVPQENLPTYTPPKTLGTKVKDLGVGLVKGIVEPVATMVARPIQLGAELAGASDEAVNKFTKEHFGDWVAPTPQSGADVTKDVGRGIQTALLGGIGSTAKTAFGLATAKNVVPSLGKVAATSALEGAGFGLGAGLEEGGSASDVLKSTALGGVIGGVAPIALKGIGKLLNKSKVAPIVEKTTTKEIAPTIEKTLTPEIKPTVPKASVTPEVPTSTKPNIPPEVIQSGETVLNKAFPEQALDNTHKAKAEAFAQDIATDPALVEKYATGEIAHPLGASYNTAYNSLLSNYASKAGDMALLDRVTNVGFNKPLSTAGQILESGRLREKGTIADIITETKKGILDRFQNETKKNVEKDFKQFSDNFSKEINKITDRIPTKEDIIKIVDSLICP